MRCVIEADETLGSPLRYFAFVPSMIGSTRLNLSDLTIFSTKQRTKTVGRSPTVLVRGEWELGTLAIGKTVSGTDFSDRMGWTGQFPECAQSATRFDSPPVRKRDLGTVKGDSLSAPRATEKRVCSAWNLAQGGFFKFTYSGRQLS
jgi:hypothetical protein